MLSIVSMLSVESDSIFYYPKGKKKEAEQSKRKFLSYEGDHFTLLNIYKSWISNNQSKDWCFQNFVNGKSLQKAKNIRDQLRQYLVAMNFPILSCLNDVDPIKKSFITGIFFVNIFVIIGFFCNIAKLQPDGSYKTVVDNRIVQIHPASVLQSKKVSCLLYNELVMTSKPYLRDCMIVEESWLSDLVSHFYENKK